VTDNAAISEHDLYTLQTARITGATDW